MIANGLAANTTSDSKNGTTKMKNNTTRAIARGGGPSFGALAAAGGTQNNSKNMSNYKQYF